MSNTKRSALAIVAVILLVVLLAFTFWPSAQTSEGKTDKSVPVLVAQASRQDYPLRLHTVGRVQASETVTLKARIGGMITEVLLPEGRHVKKGAVLIKLDDAELHIRLTQAEAAQAGNQALLSNARIELSRNEQLKEKNYVSEDILRTARTNVASLEAAVKGDKAAVDNILLQLSYTVIRAPFDGRVGARVVFPGTLVTANDTVLAVIHRVHPVQVSFSVPDRYLGQLQTLRSGGQMNINISSDTDTSLNVSGHASFIDNAVDISSGTIQVKATLNNDDNRLTPGAFVKVSLELEILPDAITIPAAAVQQNGDNSTVYIIDADQKARLRPVKIGDIRDDIAIIAEGVNAGETVVISGHLRLTPDARVQIRQEQQ